MSSIGASHDRRARAATGARRQARELKQETRVEIGCEWGHTFRPCPHDDPNDSVGDVTIGWSPEDYDGWQDAPEAVDQ